jgi:hypothetical protein
MDLCGSLPDMEMEGDEIMSKNTGKKDQLLNIYKGATGKVTHEGHNNEPSDRELKGYQPARVQGITTFKSGCNYGS